MKWLAVSFSSSFLVGLFALGGCSKRESTPAGPEIADTTSATQPRKLDVCSFLTSDEIRSVLGEPLKESRATEQSGGKFRVVQCNFGLPSTANAISLTVTRKREGSTARAPREFWEEMFHRRPNVINGRDNNKASEEPAVRESAPPQKVEGLGEEAYWMGTPITNALYVLKGDTFIRLSVGGPGNQTAKLEKAQALAEMVLGRL